MTIRWCVCCQEFMGETAPFENFEVSHGFCPPCAIRGLDLGVADLERAKKLVELQKRFLAAGHEGACFVTPLLRHIGSQWTLGQVTVTEDHLDTTFCARQLSLARSEDLGTFLSKLISSRDPAAA